MKISGSWEDALRIQRLIQQEKQRIEVIEALTPYSKMPCWNPQPVCGLYENYCSPCLAREILAMFNEGEEKEKEKM